MGRPVCLTAPSHESSPPKQTLETSEPETSEEISVIFWGEEGEVFGRPSGEGEIAVRVISASSPPPALGPPQMSSLVQSEDQPMPDSWKIAEAPTSPPTHIAELPDMESEPPREFLPINQEGWSLRDMGWEVARLTYRLRELRRGAQSWAPKLNALGAMALEHERVLKEVPPVVHRLDHQQAALLHGLGQLQNYVGGWASRIETAQQEIQALQVRTGDIPPLQQDLRQVHQFLQECSRETQKCTRQVAEFERMCVNESETRQREECRLAEEITKVQEKKQELEVLLRNIPQGQSANLAQVGNLEARLQFLER